VKIVQKLKPSKPNHCLSGQEKSEKKKRSSNMYRGNEAKLDRKLMAKDVLLS
jgi:hypothetical protein